MDVQRIHTVSTVVLMIVAFVALLAVLSGSLQPPQSDEGTAAHVFQLAIAALVPALIVVAATADRTQPLRSARATAVPAAMIALAFGALYYLEHLRSCVA